MPNFTFISVDSHLADIASRIVLETGLRGMDSVYVALAGRYELELVTLDKEQLKKGKEIASVRMP